MYIRDKYRTTKEDQGSKLADFYLNQIERYLRSLLEELDNRLDKRLVRTFVDVFLAVVRFRNRAFGLVLSELGAVVDHPTHAPAGTKRISNLLRSKKWAHQMVEDFLIKVGVCRAEVLERQGKQLLFVWDDSVVEKPESWYTQGLCPVGSSKSKRLQKVKPGYYRPPAGRVCVPGFEWSSVIMTTLDTVPAVVLMRWWTTRGLHTTDRKSVFLQMLKKLTKHFKTNALHVLDRGYASAWALEKFFQYHQRFLVRWVKTHLFLNEKGELLKVSRFFGPKQACSSRLIFDTRRNQHRRVKLFFAQVRHPEFQDHALTLVTCKYAKPGNEPFHLISNHPVTTSKEAWALVFSYMRRWMIEQTFRFNKSELALESPRLWFWDNRLKLMAIVSLVYDFLLQMVRNWNSMVWITVNSWCPRTGKRLSEVQVPLSRLRFALQAIFIQVIAQNSG